MFKVVVTHNNVQGYYNIYFLDITNEKNKNIELSQKNELILLKNENLLPPAWVQGIRVLAWSADSSQIFFLENHLGSLVLKKISLETKVSQLIATPPYTLLEQIAVSSRGEIGLIGQSAALAPRILVFSEGQERVAARSLPDAIPEEYFSAAQSVQWTSSDGVEVHGLYYPPANPDFSAEGAPQ